MVTSHTSKFSKIMYDANRRGITFSLPFNRYKELLKKPCFYCGSDKVGIDRLENHIGYTVHNSVPCCKKCNRMKSDFTLSVFLEHVRKIGTFTLSPDEIYKKLKDFQND